MYIFGLLGHLVAAMTKEESSIVCGVEAGERSIVVILNGVVEHVVVAVVAVAKLR